MAKYPRPRRRDEFEIAIICALTVESDAVEDLLDEDYDAESYGKAHNDCNAYTAGRIGNHYVVLVYMPGMGKANAAAVACNIGHSFKGIKLGILVGVCGGAPKTRDEDETEILLGDVIISKTVVQGDFGRQHPHAFIRKDTPEDNLSRANPEIRSFVNRAASSRVRKKLQDKTVAYSTLQNARYPGVKNDKLYPTEYRHKHQNSDSCDICRQCRSKDDEVCEIALNSSCSDLGCDESLLIPRKRARDASKPFAPKPLIHFGRIASGDAVIKSGVHRDEIWRRENVIGFEMEGAGVWDSLPTVIIKSVCDYADSHKSKNWQKYAAITAAACMKAFLEEWTSAGKKRLSVTPPAEGANTRPVGDAIEGENGSPRLEDSEPRDYPQRNSSSDSTLSSDRRTGLNSPILSEKRGELRDFFDELPRGTDPLCSFSADGQSLLLWIRSGQHVGFYDISSGQAKTRAAGGKVYFAAAGAKRYAVILGKGNDSVLRVHQMADGARVSELSIAPEVLCIALSRNDKFLALGVTAGVWTYDIENKLKLPPYSLPPDSKPTTQRVCFSADCKKVIVATRTRDGHVYTCVIKCTTNTSPQNFRQIIIPAGACSDFGLTSVLYDETFGYACVTAWAGTKPPSLFSLQTRNHQFLESGYNRDLNRIQCAALCVSRLALVNQENEIFLVQNRCDTHWDVKKIPIKDLQRKRVVRRDNMMAMAMPKADTIHLFWTDGEGWILKTIRMIESSE